MNRDPRLMIFAFALAVTGISGAATRGLMLAGLVLLLLFLAAIIAASQGALPAASLLFAGEPLCLLSGPDLLLTLLAHCFLLGLFLAASGTLAGTQGWGAFFSIAFLALLCTLLLSSVSPLVGMLIPLTLAAGCGAVAYLGVFRLRVHSAGGTP